MIKPQLGRLFLITVCYETLLSTVLFILEADPELAALVGFSLGENMGLLRSKQNVDLQEYIFRVTRNSGDTRQQSPITLGWGGSTSF